MPMRLPMVFDRERCALFSMLVEQACEAAVRQGLFLGKDERKARMILGGRLIGAFEAGETDIERLQAVALRTIHHALRMEGHGPQAVRSSSEHVAMTAEREHTLHGN